MSGSATRPSRPRARPREGEPGLLAASASVEGAQLALGSATVSVGALDATQTASCTGATTVRSGSSRVEALVVNGTAVPLVADRPVDLAVGPVRIRANQFSGDTRTALVLDDGAGRGRMPQVCPEGADSDVSRNRCVIQEDGDGGADQRTETIVVGQPFEGACGGTLISLDEGRQRVADGRLPASRCLRGAGPDHVALGSAGADTITGANTAHRILALGRRDRVSGGVGDDCVDGGTGADRLTGGIGRDRLLGGAGSDQLSGSVAGDLVRGQGGRDVLQGGDGNDRLSGGGGRDAVNGGSGTDRLRGGSGNDSVNTGFGRDRLDVGRGRDSLRINRNERRRQGGCERYTRSVSRKNARTRAFA